MISFPKVAYVSFRVSFLKGLASSMGAFLLCFTFTLLVDEPPSIFLGGWTLPPQNFKTIHIFHSIWRSWRIPNERFPLRDIRRMTSFFVFPDGVISNLTTFVVQKSQQKPRWNHHVENFFSPVVKHVGKGSPPIKKQPTPPKQQLCTQTVNPSVDAFQLPISQLCFSSLRSQPKWKNFGWNHHL